jgi:translation initiation factor RLI1
LKTALLDELKEYHKSHIPIPPTNMVRDALKKMMEEREKSVDVEGEKEKKELKESWCNGKTACCNFICPQNAFVLPAPLDRPIIHDQSEFIVGSHLILYNGVLCTL